MKVLILDGAIAFESLPQAFNTSANEFAKGGFFLELEYRAARILRF